MRIARRVLVLGLFIAALVFGWRLAAENGGLVTVHYLAGELPALPLWAVLLVSFASGVTLAGSVGLYKLARLRLINRRYRKTAHGLEAEVHQLRNLPLAAEDSVPGDPAAAARGAPPAALERSA
jgi:uncharacterized integral membrane protein